MSAITDINGDLEPEVQTDKSKTKMLPCVNPECRRGCVVNQFKDPRRTLCTPCRESGFVLTRDGTFKTAEESTPATQFEFNEELETETLTDAEQTKEAPCSQCQRRCVVTLFATVSKVKCNTCRGKDKHQKREKVLVSQAKDVSAATLAQLDNLVDGIINPPFKHAPLCPFDPDHLVELKYICHNPNYGPRQFAGWEKGVPKYHQETGETVNYQCTQCNTVISYSTSNPNQMQAQNEARQVHHRGPSSLETMLGVRAA